MNPAIQRFVQNAVTRPAVIKGVGDIMDPVWDKAQTKVMSVPLWAFAIGGLVYLLWQAKPGFGLSGWVKSKVNSW